MGRPVKKFLLFSITIIAPDLTRMKYASFAADLYYTFPITRCPSFGHGRRKFSWEISKRSRDGVRESASKDALT